MDLVKEYLGYAFYYGVIAGVVICHLILLGHILWHKQWLIFFITIFFDVPCWYAEFGLGVGALIPLVIGWQEAKKWNIKKLMIIYSIFVFFGFFIVSHNFYVTLTTHKEEIDPRTKKPKVAAPGKGSPKGQAPLKGQAPPIGIPKPR